MVMEIVAELLVAPEPKIAVRRRDIRAWPRRAAYLQRRGRHYQHRFGSRASSVNLQRGNRQLGRGPVVSPDERALVRALVTFPGRPAPMPAQEFLRRFGATDGKTLGRDLVRDAEARRDSLDIEYAMIVCFKLGLLTIWSKV
jgi:hypothetical protein